MEERKPKLTFLQWLRQLQFRVPLRARAAIEWTLGVVSTFATIIVSFALAIKYQPLYLLLLLIAPFETLLMLHGTYLESQIDCSN